MRDINSWAVWYRRTWLGGTAALAVWGVAGAAGVTGAAGAMVLALVGGLLAASAGLPGPRSRRRTSAGSIVLRAGLGAVLPLAVAGLLLMLGVAGVWVVLLVAGAGLPLWSRRGRSARRAGRDTPPDPRAGAPAIESIPADPLPAPRALAELPTAQLCWVWRLTYARLCRPQGPSYVFHLVQVRAVCLDELQRRDPVAFSRWFPTARAASDPARFFCRQPQT